jgi:hypothetical protein
MKRGRQLRRPPFFPLLSATALKHSGRQAVEVLHQGIIVQGARGYSAHSVNVGDNARGLTGHTAGDGFEFGVVQFADVVHANSPAVFGAGPFPQPWTKLYEKQHSTAVTVITKCDRNYISVRTQISFRELW